MSDNRGSYGIDNEDNNELEPRVSEVFPDDDIMHELTGYLKREYHEVVDNPERGIFLEDLKEYKRIAKVKPKASNKDYPWPGASNVTTPFTLSNVNGVFSYLKAAITEQRPRWQVDAGDDEYEDHADAISRWINEIMTSELHVNIRAVDEEMLWNIIVCGTQVADVPWTTKRAQFKRKASDGGVEVVDKVVYDGPVVEPVAIEDVIVRSHWNLQKGPYIGFARTFTRQELEQEEHNGFFEDIDRVLHAAAVDNQVKSQDRLEMGINSSYTATDDAGQLYTIVKFYVRWDADNDGVAEDIILWFEPESGTILRAEWNEISLRPAARGIYLPIPGLFYGLGIPSVLYSLQEEIDTMHNIGVNNLHIASLQMYVTPTGSSIGDNEAFFPLKNIKVDDPSRDFVPIAFPNVSNETLRREQVAREYGRTVGVSEAQLGMPDTTAKSGTSPTLQQFLSQQGNTVLRSIGQSVAQFYAELGMHVLLQLVANSDRILFGNRALLRLAPKEDQEFIEEVLRMPVEEIPQLFMLTVKTTEADKTEDARRQFLMTRQQLYSMYIQQAMEIVQMMDNPQVQQMPNFSEFINKVYVGLTKQMEETLELFDVSRTGDYIPDVEMMATMLELMEVVRQPMVAQAKEQLRSLKGEQEGSRGSTGQPGIQAGGSGAPAGDYAPEGDQGVIDLD